MGFARAARKKNVAHSPCRVSLATCFLVNCGNISFVVKSNNNAKNIANKILVVSQVRNLSKGRARASGYLEISQTTSSNLSN